MADIAEAAASLQSLQNSNGAGLLAPPGRTETEGSPAQSHNGTRASSIEDDSKNGHRDEGTRRPSTTVSGASSVSGGNNGMSAANAAAAMFAPLTAKKGPQSFFSGSKIKHLKKQDGIPLWRVDIQFEFLQAVFKDPNPVFTNVYSKEKGQTFADIYIDAMARSSKTSKILRDKLMSERENAANMAMVCLLVNIGRMNTTLNFFPEMKAQLRTYHAIPSLQTHTDSNDYKQLQDAPRLKSILKGACEDRAEPQTLDQIKKLPSPATNPINLVFILSQYAPKVSEAHFPENMDFYDLVMRVTLSSKSRARAFLWLMWHYLEGDYSDKACMENPFGKGKLSRDKSRPWCVPDFEYLTEDQAAKENVDTEEEKAFGEAKQEERKRLLGEIQSAPPGSGRGRGRKDKSFELGQSPGADSPAGSPPPSSSRRRPYTNDYDTDSHTRSVSPDTAFSTPNNGNKPRRPHLQKVNHLLISDAFETPKNKGGRPRNSAKRNAEGDLKARLILTKGGRPLAPSQPPDPRLLNMDRSSPVISERIGPRVRMTSHQMAVQQNRKDRVNHYIDVKLRTQDKRRKRSRHKQGAIARAWARVKDLEEPLYMSDDDSRPLKHHSHTIDAMDAEGNTIHHEEEEHMHPVKKQRLERSQKAINGTFSRGPAGLILRVEEEGGDGDDFGEEALSLSASLRRTWRRLDRWNKDDPRLAVGLGVEDVPLQHQIEAAEQEDRMEEDAEGDEDEEEEAVDTRRVEAQAEDEEDESDEDEDEDGDVIMG
ncbi:hypothetical protein FPQ18DRAFT_156621 [Pyronema domesticum]|uniref:Similar to Ino eighty subunit 1 acc. no. C8V8H5 n=1 Tax=Pyronema omphalodes (strain CBS 100304) TaxID=1076935 RepID=U4L4C5_PYROM|nr:hypothetical protein FPQ18DRAFT_156621 [Pyronema domesticum]CCX11759.1 Similar to Ino eighty subunit 1; acc. no. C8V8H5 [Pyronema omphalodes CBS 100304]